MSSLASSSGRRLLVFACVVVLAAALGIGYVAMTSADIARQHRTTVATKADRALAMKTVLAGPHILFRSTALGPTYGLLAAVPLDRPAGPRATDPLECDRVYGTSTNSVCVTADRGVITSYKLSVLDSRLHARTSFDLNGLPSRARVSATGKLAATTTFVSGHSYAGIDFSTETVIYDLTTDKSLGNVEDWTIVVDGHVSHAADLNVWGVTFAPNAPDVFYATVATAGKTWLAQGSIAKRTLTSIHEAVECPSISPDGRKIAFKRKVSTGTVKWRLTVLDVATQVETPLRETRSVDDQPEWLDNDHVLYGLQRPGTAISDVWSVAIDGSQQPSVFLPRAWSPAVVPTGTTGP